MKRQRLGEILVQAGLLRLDQLEAGLREQERWGGPLGQILVSKNLISEDALVQALSRQLNIPIIDLAGMRVPKDVLALVPVDLAHEHIVLPFRRSATILDVAMANPLDLGITDELRIRTKLTVRPSIAGASAIHAALRLCYGTSMPLEIMGDARPQGRRAAPLPAEPVPPAEFKRLQERVAALEARVAHYEGILRKMLGLLIEKDVASRDEVLSAIR
jgi:hypothetical protein